MPAATIVIPTLDEAAHIDEALGRARSQTLADLEILVVDGGSSDSTRDRVRTASREDARVRLLDNPDRIQSAALNIGLGEARGEVLVRLDGHSFVGPGYVARVLHDLEATGASGVGGRMQALPGVDDKTRGFAVANRATWGAGPAAFHRATEPGPADTVYLGSYPVDELQRVGGWDADLATNEDYELNYRLRQSGKVLWYDPELVVEYQPRATYRSLARQYRRYGEGKARMLARHPESIRPRQLAPALGIPAATGAWVVAGPFGPAVLGATHAGGLAAASWSSRPPSLAAGAHAAAAAFTMHWSWSAGFWWGGARGATRRLATVGRHRR